MHTKFFQKHGSPAALLFSHIQDHTPGNGLVRSILLYIGTITSHTHIYITQIILNVKIRTTFKKKNTGGEEAHNLQSGPLRLSF